MTIEWTTSCLEKLSINFDGRRRPVKGSERRSGPYPYYGASGVVDHVDDYIFDGEYLLVAEDGENLRTRNTPIAFLATGKFWVNNHAHIVTGNENADTRFLMYALRNVDIDAYLTGAVMPKLTQENLNRIEVSHPDLSEQRAIASVLGALDDKIEQNRCTAQALEKLARAIFRAWFVDFEPVKAKAAGATSFPSMPQPVFDALPTRLVDSDIGPVPEGWEVKMLSQLTGKITKGTTPRQEDVGLVPTETGINYLRANAVTDDGLILHDKLQRIPKTVHEGALKRSILRKDDVLYTIAGTIGRTAMVDEDLLPANTNQAVAIIRCDPTLLPPNLLFLAIIQPKFQDELHRNVVQAVQANLSLGMIGKAKL